MPVNISNMHKNTKLLLVEDDDIVLKPYAEMFRSAGYEVLTARTVEEGVSILEKHHPDVVLCDMRMDSESGLELLSIRDVSEDKTTRKVPIIMMTDVPDDEFAATALSLGAKDIVFKSYSQPKKVLSRVAQVVS